MALFRLIWAMTAAILVFPVCELRLLVDQELPDQGRPPVFGQQQGQGFAHGAHPLGNSYPVFQQDATDLVDQRGPVAHLSLPHPM